MSATDVMLDLTMAKGAVFSEDRRHRFALWRVWKENPLLLLFIGLNPSTADEFSEDPTITRMMKRADLGGYGGLLVGNLYSFVSTQPRALLKNDDAVRLETDRYLRAMVDLSAEQLCGWGSFKPVWQRFIIVHDMLVRPICLGKNPDGQPKHPLYIGYSVQPQEYNLVPEV